MTTEKGKLIVLKEGKNLLQRFIIIARSRTELNLKECIGEFEFGVVPRSLFSADGSLLPMRDKHKVSNMIVKAVDNNWYEEGLLLNNLNDTSEENVYSSLDNVVNPYKVILFDGMTLVNTLPK